MPEKIIIDAGHGGYDNGASYNNHLEKEDSLKLALAVGRLLEKDGYNVFYTRTDDTYTSPAGKAKLANTAGGDLFVSIHRNSSTNPNKYNGVQSLIYNNEGLKPILADNINDELEKIGYKNLGIELRPNLAVLRKTKMPAILVEAGFINSDTDNEIFDTKFNETAKAIANGIEKTLQPGAATIIYNYQLLLGCYKTIEAAQKARELLSGFDIDADIYYDDEIYQLRLGNYETTDDCIYDIEDLTKNGIDYLIVGWNSNLYIVS